MASMRGEAPAEGQRPLGIANLSPMKSLRSSWWADELASAMAAIAATAATSLRRTRGRENPPNMRSGSDLCSTGPHLEFPPTIDTECNEQTEVDSDEALRTIVSRVKEDKKRKKRLQEAEAATIATLEGSRGQVRKGNFSAREVRDPPNSIPTPPIFQCNHSYVFPVILFYF